MPNDLRPRNRNKDAYSAKDLQVLSGLDPVRKRPGMYTDTTRPNHLVQEVVDNSVDEALAGYATRIGVLVRRNGSIRIEDDGRGMPVDRHPQYKLSGVELILTKLHSGAKFNDANYSYAGGLHGVGVSVVNALSATLDVEVRRDGRVHCQHYENGRPQGRLRAHDKILKRDTGTAVDFLPDGQYFDSPQIALRPLRHLLRAKAVLCPGLSVTLTAEGQEPESEEWHYADGVAQYLASQTEGYEGIPQRPLSFSGKANGGTVDWALQWLLAGEPFTESYVNAIPTTRGGTHVGGLRRGIHQGLIEFCEFRDLLPKGLRLSAEDVFRQCAYVLSIRMHDPRFSGQTKESLSSREAGSFVAQATSNAYGLWLNENPHDGEKLAALAIDNARQRTARSRKTARKKTVGGPTLPGKLADCSGHETMESELFLVEGDSAGGSARQARDREFQAVMPLRGKILNTWESSVEEAMASREVRDIATAIGVEPGSDDIAGLRYGRICILADADSDGAHIATLLCGLFTRHFRPLVRAGHFYIAMPPLFRIDVGKRFFYALDENERDRIIEQAASTRRSATPQVQRFKGLGEMNPAQLRETTMAPATRRLVRLVDPSPAETDEGLDLLLARRRAPERRAWLEREGDRAQI